MPRLRVRVSLNGLHGHEMLSTVLQTVRKLDASPTGSSQPERFTRIKDTIDSWHKNAQ